MNFTLCKNRCNYTNRNKQPRTPLFPSQPPKTALSLASHLHPCHMNALLALRPCKALGRSTSGIHARPLSKVRCCRPKKFGRLPEGLSLHQPSQNRTIPRKSPTPSPCLLLPLHQPLLFPLIFAKEHLSLALLAPVALNTATFASIFLIQYTNYG